MFEPDGRNSIQYSGHLLVTSVKIVTGIIALPAIIFAFMFIYTYFQVQAQRVDFAAFDHDTRAVEAIIDFNQADLSLKDLWNIQKFGEKMARMKVLDILIAAKKEEGYTAETEFQHNLERTELEDERRSLEAMDPALSTAAFSVNFLEGKSPQDARRTYKDTYTATPAQWMYFAAPFHEGLTRDYRYQTAHHVGILESMNSYGGQDFDMVDRASSGYDRHGNSDGAIRDSWVDYGLFKLAPTKKWDWSAGRLQIHAKASYNYAAYVGAARVVTRVRMMAAMEKAGFALRGDFWETAVPADEALMLPADRRDAFIEYYNKLFKGDLPIVYARFQSLDDSIIQGYMWPGRSEDRQLDGKMGFPMDSDERGDWNEYHQWFNAMGVTDYIMTGLRLPKTDATGGRVGHSMMDIFFNSSPSLNSDSVAAQQELRKLMTYRFWDPLLDKYGLVDMKEKVKAIITEENKNLAYDIQFAKMHAHNVYRYRANDGTF